MLEGLEQFNAGNEPSDIERIHFLFFEHGVGIDRFSEYPIPYILSIVKTNNYAREQEAKAMKK